MTLIRSPERWTLLQSNASPKLETVAEQFDQANLWLLRSDRMMGYNSKICLHAAICYLGAAMKELLMQTNTSEQLLVKICQSLTKTTGIEIGIRSNNVSAFYSESSDLRSAMRMVGYDSDDLEELADG